MNFLSKRRRSNDIVLNEGANAPRITNKYDARSADSYLVKRTQKGESLQDNRIGKITRCGSDAILQPNKASMMNKTMCMGKKSNLQKSVFKYKHSRGIIGNIVDTAANILGNKYIEKAITGGLSSGAAYLGLSPEIGVLAGKTISNIAENIRNRRKPINDFEMEEEEGDFGRYNTNY